MTANSIFHLSPIIRITLLTLYIALTVPLPILAKITSASVPPSLLIIGIITGFAILYAVLSERVIADEEKIQVTYPVWIPRFFLPGWSLLWSDIKDLKPRTTGQGGLVYYFISHDGKGYLLPMRIAGLSRLLKIVQEKTNINTHDVNPFSQPWMYIILFGCTLLLLLVDIWTITNSMTALP